MSQESNTGNKDSNRLIVNTLNNLFSDNQKKQLKLKNQGQQPSPSDTRHLELALTTVLVDLAVSDQNFEPSEYTIIQKSLQALFGTPKTEISNLVNQAVAKLKNLRGSAPELAILKEQLNDQQKQMVVKAIDDVIDADGVEDGFEVYMRAKFIDLLGLENTKK